MAESSEKLRETLKVALYELADDARAYLELLEIQAEPGSVSTATSSLTWTSP